MEQFSKGFVDGVWRQKYLLIGSVVVCSIISMIGVRFVPKTYKLQTSLSIRTQYFQIPLVRDFLPETFDPQEMKAQREALVRHALNHRFLSEIAKKYSLLPPAVAENPTSYDIEEFSKKFEIIPLGPTSFMINVFAADPMVGYKVINDTVSHIRATLAEERKANLLKIHDAIQERLESLSFGKQSSGTSSMLASRPDLVQQEVARIDEEIKVLRTNYSDAHPRISQLIGRRAELQKWLKPPGEVTPSGGLSKSQNFSGAKVDQSSKALFEDLLKKFHYLEVVIFLDQQSRDDYLTVIEEPFVPKAAVSPKKPIYLAWGIVMGFFIGALIGLMLEVKRLGNTLDSSVASAPTQAPAPGSSKKSKSWEFEG